MTHTQICSALAALAIVATAPAQTLAQQAYFKASNTGGSDRFGYAVALSGDTAVVGVYLEDSDGVGVNGVQNNNNASSSGAAYVFVRSGTNWSQQAYLKASNAEGGDRFGWSVAMAGDTIVVGATRDSSAATGVNGNQADNSAGFSGAAYVFVRAGTNWTQQAYLKAHNTDANDAFGTAVAVAGDVLVVGAPVEASNATGVNGDGSNNSAPSSGATYVFVRTGTNWTQEAFLKAHNAGTNDLFGTTVSVSGGTVLVGALEEDSSANTVNGDGNNNAGFNAGATYVFVRDGTNWSQQAYLKASNTNVRDQFNNTAVESFGGSVSLDGDTALIGAYEERSNVNGVNGSQTNASLVQAGAAYVFVRSGTNWSQQAYLKASNTEGGDFFGWAVALSGDTALVTALNEGSNAMGVNGSQTNNFANFSGAAYVFVRAGTNWTQQAYLKSSNTEANDSFGRSVAVSQGSVFVGADFEDSNATGVNGLQFNNSLSASGAAYLFTGIGSGTAPAPPRLTGPTVAANGSFQFAFTSKPATTFNVVAATNLAQPLNSWTTLAPPTEISPGVYQVSDSQAASQPRRFYSVRSP